MIKFRAWDKDKKVMRKVAHIYNLLTVGTTVVVRENAEGAIVKIERALEEGSYELMSFAGRHDKNGVEIYEGDILCYGKYTGYKELEDQKIDCLYFVVWDEESACYAMREINCPDAFRKEQNLDYSPSLDAFGEVIGNVHQHPELLDNQVGG